jgi:DNA transformation protein
MTACHSELLQLKNLGMASVNILRAIGINTYADLKRTGAVEAYRRIRARDDIPPDLKARLVSEAEIPDQGNFSQATA